MTQLRSDRGRHPDSPDTAYGWVVVTSSLFVMLATSELVAGFGILYTPYAEAFNTDRATTGWISSLLMFTSGVAGLLSGFVTDKFGCRSVCIVGSLMGSAGILIASFSPNIYVLYLANGLIIGPGFGIAFLCSSVIVQQWFVKKRALAAAIANSGMPLGSVVTGPLTTFLYENMGWRGTLSVYAGLVLNTVVAAALFRPVRKQKVTAAVGLSTITEIKNSTQHFTNVTAGCNNTDVERKESVLMNGLNHNITDQVITDKMTTRNKHCGRSLKKLNISIFIEPQFMILGLGTLFANYGLQTLKYHSPSRAANKGVSTSLVQFLPMVHGISSILGRVFGGFIGSSRCANIPLQYSLSIIIGGVFTSAVGFTDDNFTLIVICMAPASFLIGVFLGIQTTLVTELVGLSCVARASGVLFAFIAIASLTATPFSGWLYDISQDYNVPFLVTGAIQSAGGVILLYLPYKMKTRRPLTNSSS